MGLEGICGVLKVRYAKWPIHVPQPLIFQSRISLICIISGLFFKQNHIQKLMCHEAESEQGLEVGEEGVGVQHHVHLFPGLHAYDPKASPADILGAPRPARAEENTELKHPIAQSIQGKSGY